MNLILSAMKTFMTVVIALILLLGTAPAWAGPYDEYAGEKRESVNLIITEKEAITEPLSAMGVNVDMRGTSEKETRLFGVRVKTSGTFKGPVSIRAAQAEIGGTFLQGVDCMAANAQLSGSYAGDVVVRAANIELDSTLAINGNFRYTAKSITGLDKARISGTVSQIESEPANDKVLRQWQEYTRRTAAAFAVSSWIISFCSALLTGYLVLRFFPEQVERIVGTMHSSPWPSILFGFIFLVVTPIALLLTMITVVGIPIAMVAGMLYLVILYFAPIMAGLSIGRMLITRLRGAEASRTLFLPLISGILLIWLIQLIPIIGWIGWFILFLLGIGGIWLTFWSGFSRKGRGAERLIAEDDTRL